MHRDMARVGGCLAALAVATLMLVLCARQVPPSATTDAISSPWATRSAAYEDNMHLLPIPLRLLLQVVGSRGGAARAQALPASRARRCPAALAETTAGAVHAGCRRGLPGHHRQHQRQQRWLQRQQQRPGPGALHAQPGAHPQQVGQAPAAFLPTRPTGHHSAGRRRTSSKPLPGRLPRHPCLRAAHTGATTTSPPACRTRCAQQTWATPAARPCTRSTPAT
jgi:hypothetical protein